MGTMTFSGLITSLTANKRIICFGLFIKRNAIIIPGEVLVLSLQVIPQKSYWQHLTSKHRPHAVFRDNTTTKCVAPVVQDLTLHFYAWRSVCAIET